MVESEVTRDRHWRPQALRRRRRSARFGPIALALVAMGPVAGPARATPDRPTWPTEVVRLAEVLRAARDEGTPRPAVSQRLSAAQALALFPAELSGPHLAAALSDPAPQVRLAAIDGCERVLASACAPGLSKLAREDASAHVRIAAMGTLAALAPVDAVQVLTEVFGDRAPDLRAEALRLFGELGPVAARHGANAAVAVARRLTDPVAAVRAQAAAALGRIAGPAAAPLLLPLLSDPAPDVQKAAATALARIDAPDAVAALAAGLEQRADRSVHWVFLEALARLSDPRAEAVLRVAIDLPPEDFGPVQVLRAIADRPAPSPGFARAIADGIAHRGDWSPTVRRAAAEALLRFGAVGAQAAKAAAEDAPPSRAAALRRIAAAQGIVAGAAPGSAPRAAPDPGGTTDPGTPHAPACPGSRTPPSVAPPAPTVAGPLQGPLRERLRRAVAERPLDPADHAALATFLAAPYPSVDAAPLLARAGAGGTVALSPAAVRRLGALVRAPTTPPGVACLALLAVVRGAPRSERGQARALIEAASAAPSPSLRACAVAASTAAPAAGPGRSVSAPLDPARAVAATLAAATQAPEAPPRDPVFPWILPAPPPQPRIRAFAGGDARAPVGFPDLLLGAIVRPVTESDDPGSPMRMVRWPGVCRAVAVPKVPLGTTYFSVVPASSVPATDAGRAVEDEAFSSISFQ